MQTMTGNRMWLGQHNVTATGILCMVSLGLAAWSGWADMIRNYIYDSQGRVRRIECGDRSVTYTYDHKGRVFSRTESGATTKRLYDGNKAVSEYGSTQQRCLHGAGVDEVLGFLDGSARYLHCDGLNNVTLITDESNRVLERVSYDSFGVPAFRDAEYGPAESVTGNRRLFTGREWEPALGVYNYRARFYSPQAGRFVAPDPIGIEGGLNLYAYCANNPVNLTDPLGLEACDTESKKASYPPIIQGREEQQLWDISTPAQRDWLVYKFSNDPWYYHFPIEETPYNGWEQSGNLSDVREDLEGNLDPASYLRLYDSNGNDNDPLRFGRYHFTSDDVHLDHYSLAEDPLGHLWQDGGIKDAVEKVKGALGAQE